MVRIVLVLIALIVLPLSPLGAASVVDKWTPFAPEGDVFQVKLPGTPVKKTRKKWLPIGTVTSTVFKVELPNDTFGLSITDLPGMTFAFRSRDKIVEQTAEGFIEDAGAQLTHEKKSELGGLPAKELSYNIPANKKHEARRGVSRMLIDDKRLYIFYAEVSPAVTPEQIKAYFDSVRIKPAQEGS